MSKTAMIVIGVIGVFISGILIIGGYVVSINNSEVSLRVTIEAKQTDNTSEYDNMWKKISQVAQVTTAQKDALLEIFTAHAQARTTDGGGLMKWIQESVPNVDTTTFNNLQNIITSSRDSWTMRQKELIDLSREHNKLLQMFPSSLVCSMLGKQKIEIQIVTSGKTKEAFATGEDNDVKVFN